MVGLLAGVCAPGAARAQPASATLAGFVRDQAREVVEGARVTATDADRAQQRSALTGPDGAFAIPSLAPGRYSVAIELAGFAPVTYDAVRLSAGETVHLEVDLALAHLVETVELVGLARRSRAGTAALGHAIDAPQIAGLPLNGRSFIGLVALSPGVALPRGSAFPRINGGRPRTNEYLFDGISVLQPEPGQVAYLPVVDAIASLTVETNSPPAEYGRFNGGVVALTTKSGTNTLAGTAFGFLRHEALNARHSFAPAGGARPRFRRVQTGGVAGGPIVPSRTFFFADYQAQRQQIARTAISTVPTLLQRGGVFTEAIAGRVEIVIDPVTGAPFAGNAIPAERVDPVAASLVARYPLPTSAGTENNFRRQAAETHDQDQASLRIDHHIRAAGDALFARFTSFADDVAPVTPLPDGSGATSGTAGPQRTRAHALAASYVTILSPSLVHEVRIGNTARAVRRRAARHDGHILPTYAIAGYQQLGSPPNTETTFDTGVGQVATTLTWTRGRHLVKAGSDLRRSRLDVLQPPSPAGFYQFSTLFSDRPGDSETGAPLASFLLGQVQSFTIDLQDAAIRNRAHTQEYFVQDTWRATSELTIDAGVRYTLNFPSVEASNRAAVFNLETGLVDYLGRNGHPRSARRLHWTNAAPRLGIARALGARAAVRVGYALVWIEQTGMTTPFTTPSFPFVQTLTQRTLDNRTPAFVLAHGPSVTPIAPTPTAGLGYGVFAVDRDLGSGYAQQWNLSVERELGRHLSLEVAYVGSKITNAGVPDTNLNQLSAETLALGPALVERVPNPFFGSVPAASPLGEPTITVAQLMMPYPQHTAVSLYRNNVGTTHYHGLTARLEQRLSRGLAYSIAYTRSKLIDDASSVFDASILTGPVASYPVADSFNRRLERDVSTGDMPHVVVASAFWEIPHTGGLTVSVLGTLQSGTPLAVTQITNFNAFAGFGTQRPNRSGDPALPRGERRVSRWFDTSVFSVAPPFTLGTSSRNPVRGPAYRNVDLAIARRARVGGTWTLETRAEIFNLLNTPALGAPNTVVGAPGFGSITSAGDPRVVQLALKLAF